MRGRGNIAVLGLPIIIATCYLHGFALKYLTPDPDQYGIYWARHDWLYAHIIAGAIALLLGPLQLWLGLNRRTGTPHRVMGVLYVLAVGVGASTAYYLAAHNDYGWVFGFGLGSMASAWVLTTLLATIAICLRKVEQHREWIIRSYVVTFSFVIFRVLSAAFDMAQLGTMAERLTAASWLAWAGPLFITESIMQGRKIFVRQPRVALVEEPAAFSAVPQPAAFDLQNRS
jgi:predicted membrane protein DUF2306